LSLTPAGAALAHSSAANLSVTAGVAPDCVLDSPSALNFGIYDPALQRGDGHVDVTADALWISCTRGAAGVAIALDGGSHALGDRRAMTGQRTGREIFYEVYTSATRSTVWNQINTVAYVPAHRGAQRILLYGRIPGGQAVSPGRYSDTLLAMVNF
jgi:spore coat protein U-like protein